MDAYTAFAGLYDQFMEEIPYEEWCRFVTGRLFEAGITEGLILDLGCGTGTMTTLLAGEGFDMIGVDRSEEMLLQAREKPAPDGADILYLCQDMRELELYGTVRAVVCVCDCFNYITDEEELLQVFRLVNNYLDPGGLFFFDLNTEYKYRELLGDATFAENRENGSFIWENYYDEAQKINEYAVTFYVRETETSDTYRRVEEFHYERAYSEETILRLLKEAGLCPVAVYDDYTPEKPKETCERMCFLAKECTKRTTENRS